jgi:hypothetical protein
MPNDRSQFRGADFAGILGGAFYLLNRGHYFGAFAVDRARGPGKIISYSVFGA